MELMESTKKRTVLIVDDEIKITEVLEAYLKNAGYQTKSVHSGQKAIEAAEELKPDLIILDLMLPDIMGDDSSEAGYTYHYVDCKNRRK